MSKLIYKGLLRHMGNCKKGNNKEIRCKDTEAQTWVLTSSQSCSWCSDMVMSGVNWVAQNIHQNWRGMDPEKWEVDVPYGELIWD